MSNLLTSFSEYMKKCIFNMPMPKIEQPFHKGHLEIMMEQRQEIIDYLKSVDDMENYYQFRIILNELKKEDKECLNPLISVFEQINKNHERICNEYERDYFLCNKDEESLSIVYRAVNNNKQGEKDIELSLYDKEMSEIEEKPIYETFKLKAYFMDSVDLEIVKLYNQDIDNFEGYEFSFEEDISKLEKPCCYHDYISDYFTVRGNEIDSNCDVNGSMAGVKAESLYMIYLTDLDKLIGVKVRYWCL